MRYKFYASVIVEPIRLQRIENERSREESFDYRHHVDPFRERGDVMTITSEIDSPQGMTEEQTAAFERATKRMLRHFRGYVAEEFDAIPSEKPV